MNEAMNSVLAQVKEQLANEPKRKINYPKHVKTLEQRVLAALNSGGCRTVETVMSYCGETDRRRVALKLGQLVARGLAGRKPSDSTGYMKYYPESIAREKGILATPKHWGGVKKAKPEAVKVVVKNNDREERPAPTAPKPRSAEQYIDFLEKRVKGWQDEARRLQRLVDEAPVVNDRATKDLIRENEALKGKVARLQVVVDYLESKRSI